jgi:predicted PurR-regulated permease PerM
MFETDSADRRFLLVLLAIATVLLFLLAVPVAPGLFASSVFAVVLFPLQRKLTKRLGDRRHVAAGLLTLGMAIAVLIPIGWVSLVVAQHIGVRIDATREVLERGGTPALIDELPEKLQPYAERLVEMIPDDLVDSFGPPKEPEPASMAGALPADEGRSQLGSGVLTSSLGRAAGFTRGVLGGVTRLLFEMGVLITGLFFLLAEGADLARWVVATAPLPRAQTEKFLVEFRDVTVGVFISTVATAALQTGIASIGYLIAGVEPLVVALFITFAAAFIPAVGGAGVVAIVGVLQLFSGHTGMGIFLVIWGLVPVGLSDNMAKPLLAKRSLRLPTSVLFFAMLAGLIGFGPMGVVAGPLIVSFFLVVVRALRENRQTKILGIEDGTAS